LFGIQPVENSPFFGTNLWKTLWKEWKNPMNPKVFHRSKLFRKKFTLFDKDEIFVK